MPRTFVAWAYYLSHTRAQAVFILGDLFEVWVGDDAFDLPFEQRCAQALKDAVAKRYVACMVGNRDFLLGDRAHDMLGTHALPDPCCIELGDTRYLMTHGDALCFDDHAYQSFRAMVRGKAWQTDFLNRPLAERLAIAAHIRNESESRKQFDGAMSADVDNVGAAQWLADTCAVVMIHGHTHKPASHDMGRGLVRHVLSDWDFDAGPPRADVLRWQPSGLSRITPEQACA